MRRYLSFQQWCSLLLCAARLRANGDPDLAAAVEAVAAEEPGAVARFYDALLVHGRIEEAERLLLIQGLDF